jgi:hypothetical protein
MVDPGPPLRLPRRLALLAAGVLAFILGLLLMKEGVVPVTPFLRTQLSVSSPASALGFGWILSSLALSGSPVAATALRFQDAGALSAERRRIKPRPGSTGLLLFACGPSRSLRECSMSCASRSSGCQ